MREADAIKEIDKILSERDTNISTTINTSAILGDSPYANTFSALFPFFIFIVIFVLSVWSLLKLKCLKPIAKFYSIRGRASRKTYWLWWFAMLPFFAVFSIFFTYLPEIILFLQARNLSPYWVIIPLYILFLAYIPYICLQIRRLHDMNLSGYWYILAFSVNHTPLVVVKWLILGCIPGSKTANKFGEPTVLRAQHSSQATMLSKLKENTEKLSTSTIALSKFSLHSKRQLFISFAIGVIIGASIVYMLTNRYASYASYRWNIVRIDRLTGKTELADVRSPNAGWSAVKEK